MIVGRTIIQFPVRRKLPSTPMGLEERRSTCRDCEHMDEYLGQPYCWHGRSPSNPPCGKCRVEVKVTGKCPIGAW